MPPKVPVRKIHIHELDIGKLGPQTIDDITKGLRIAFIGAPGSGKCLAPDTPVLMYDGRVKVAKDVVKGDLLMGDDSTSRTVLSTCSGEEEMFEIVPSKGRSYTVNAPHVLTLITCPPTIRTQHCSSGDVHRVAWLDTKQHRLNSEEFNSLTDAESFAKQLPQEEVFDIDLPVYQSTSAEFRERVFGFKAAVNCDDWAQTIQFDPYLLGYWWLGSDSIDVTKDFQKQLDIGDKRIPLSYKANTRDVRLQLLAGLIDSIGFVYPEGIVFELEQECEPLAHDIEWLCLSLGFMATIHKVGTQYTILAFGNGLDEIPCRTSGKQMKAVEGSKSATRCSLTVVPKGKGNYCGWELDGNGRFLLGDFTVTHNTKLIRDFIYSKRHIAASARAFCGSEESAKDFAELDIPYNFIHTEIDLKNPEPVIALERRQNMAIKYLEPAGQNPWHIEAFDDFAYKKELFKTEFYGKKMRNGRHWRLIDIISVQGVKDLPDDTARMFDGVFVFKEGNEQPKTKQLLYDNFGIGLTFPEFSELITQIWSERFVALYINLKAPSSDPEDVYQYYKADLSRIPDDFKPGSWDYQNMGEQRKRDQSADDIWS